MGLWIFESCLKEWRERGLDLTYEELITGIELVDEPVSLIFPDDESFMNPPSMLSAIERQLGLTGQNFDERPIFVSKTIFDSLAFRYASVLETIGALAGITISDILILGGGSRNRYLNRITADASSLPTRSGLPEASSLGNALIQAIAYGRFSTIADARNYVEQTSSFETYSPSKRRAVEAARARYLDIEARFLKT
jgi:rhamnulokinase